MSALKISVLSVAHGEFVYVETPLGDNLVIDCGCGDRILPHEFLSDVPVISELQISHPHTGHFRDLPALAEKTIRSFRCPDLSLFSDETMGWRNPDAVAIQMLRKLKDSFRVDDQAVGNDHGFSHSVWFPTVIHPNDPNSASAVTVLTYYGFTMLLGGDLPASGWKTLLRDRDFCDAIHNTIIFKTSQHGKDEGVCEELFDVISPKLCIITDRCIPSSEENAVAAQWYSKRATGCPVADSFDLKTILSTRSDGSVHIDADRRGVCRIYRNTLWHD
ncbi:MAG: hypothetical protein HY360_26280 [Verrucomicrobia bacterium]|nr:hypothetical protein [Verrucomicrobiota bacterium]